MGGGDWVQQKQEQQVQQVKKAYAEVQAKSPYTQQNIFESIKIDGVDYAYAWCRTFTPSWVMGLIFVVGLLTIAPKILEKFGLSFRIERKNANSTKKKES